VDVQWTGPNVDPGNPDLDILTENLVLGPVRGIGVREIVEDGQQLWEGFIRAGSSPTIPDGIYRAITAPKDVYSALFGAVQEVFRTDGQPDDCGDPDPQPPPAAPAPPNIPVNITYRNDDGIDITIPVNFTLGVAYIDADLNVRLPIDVNVPINISPNFDTDFNFDIAFNLSGGDTYIGPPRDPDRPPVLPPPNNSPPPPPPVTPDPPPPPPPPDLPPPTDPPEPPEPLLVIRGALVTVTGIDDAAKVGVLFQDSNPDVGIPDYGLINFLISTGESSRGWTEDIKVKNKRNLITCPWPFGAIDVKGTPRPGVSWVITPVYAQVSK
jgi:hypothetical protein